MSRSLVSLLALLPLAASAQDIPYDTFTLDNGLQVLFHQDHDLPLVTVNVIYRFGALDEPEGQTGYAHLFEHLMFMGTSRVPTGQFDVIMEAGGGWNNAGTSEDYTIYYDVGPSSLLPTLLWLEADRIERLGMDMDQAKLDLQRDVVRNERRENYENQPYGAVWLTIPEALFPEEHPYSHPVIGSHEDLIAATVEDIQAVFAKGYAPANASLVVAGDFDADDTRSLVTDLFSDIRGGEPLERPEPAPVSLESSERIELADQVELSRMYLLWHSPPAYAPGDAELDLTATILGADKSGRLSRALIHEQGLAQDVGVAQFSGLLGSLFAVIVTGREGVDPDAVEQATDEVLQAYLAAGPTPDELERARNQTEAGFVSGLESLHARASLLNHYWLFTGDPDYVERDLGRYRAATADSVLAAATEVMVPERVVLWVHPEQEGAEARAEGEAAGGEAAEDTAEAEDVVAEDATQTGGGAAEGAAEAEATSEVESDESLESVEEIESPSPRDIRPEDSPARSFVPQAPQVFELDNGLDVWLYERHAIPALQAVLLVPGGNALDPVGKEGLAELLADLLDEGAGDLDAIELAEAVDSLGASLSSYSTTETIQVSMWTLTRTASDALALMADTVMRPRLAKPDMVRVQDLTLGYITQREQDPSRVASVVGWRQYFGDGHPYAHPGMGYADSVSAIRRGDVKRLYKSAFDPARSTLVVTGDVDEPTLRELLDGTLAQWQGRGRSPAAPVFSAAAQAGQGVRVLVVDRPGAPQTAIRMVLPGEPYRSEHWVEDHLLNTVLGGTFTSRLNANLREDKGWTYGAGSRPVHLLHDGAVRISTSVQAEHSGAAVAEILAELEQMAEHGVDAEELTKAVSSTRNDAVETYAGIRSIASDLADHVEGQLPAGTTAARLDEALTIELESLGQRAADLYQTDQALIVLVGDRASLTAQLAEQGLPAPILVDVEGRVVTE